MVELDTMKIELQQRKDQLTEVIDSLVPGVRGTGLLE